MNTNGSHRGVCRVSTRVHEHTHRPDAACEGSAGGTSDGCGPLERPYHLSHA
jgi:hypothetical protein